MGIRYALRDYVTGQDYGIHDTKEEAIAANGDQEKNISTRLQVVPIGNAGQSLTPRE